MHLHSILSGRRAASLTAVLALAGSAAVMAAAGPASAATSTDAKAATHPAGIVVTDDDQWSQSQCSADGYKLCLWYHGGGQGDGGAGFGTDSSISNLSGYTFFLGGSPNNEGLGDAVRNDAGEISNGSTDCVDVVYYSPGWSGSYDYVDPTFGGNLSATLNNEDASVATC